MRKEAEQFAESTLFEGIVSLRAVVGAMENHISDRKITELYFAKSKIKSKGKELSWIRHLSEVHGFPITYCEDEEIDEMAVGNTHGGLLFRCTPRTIPELSRVNLLPNGFYIMAEGIEDPYNFGYTVRSLYAAGVDGVILPKRNWMTAAGVVCRSSAGASELVPMFSANGEDAVSVFRQMGYRIVCADLEHSVSMYDADLSRPIFAILGGEKRGISRKVLDTADAIVRIDYGRDFHAALSAASAATVLGFEIYRQNRDK